MDTGVYGLDCENKFPTGTIKAIYVLNFYKSLNVTHENIEKCTSPQMHFHQKEILACYSMKVNIC